MANNFDNVRILLTGASRGVGLAAAHLLVKDGARLFGVARDQERLTRAAAQLESLGAGEFNPLCVDLAAQDAPAIITAEVERLWGAVDIVIHNAGVMLHHDGGLLDEPEETVERTIEVNLFAPLRISRALLPLLERGNQPRLINVGSGAGTKFGLTEPGISSYRLSKWAVHGMTMLQARELDGIVSVNAFDPGWVRTDLGGPQAPGTPEEAAEGLRKTLLLPWETTGQFFKDGQEISW